MTPLDYLRLYDPEQRRVEGNYSASSLSVEEGDRVGVVLFNFGGPETLGDVRPFLYQLLMDPALLPLPVGSRLRRWLAKVVAYARAGTLRDHYEVIGGGSPLPRLTAEQAHSLQRHLNEQYGAPTGVDFRTYRAMRYWHPFSQETARQMETDDVDKVVLLPLYPQYSTFTTGSSLAYWRALNETGEIPSWPTTAVPEYAANPKYIQAVSERIDEALQRFPQDRREEAVLVFSAYGTPFKKMSSRSDPYCCLVHSTVEQVMKYREKDRPYHTAFQSLIGPSHWLPSSTPALLRFLADRGTRSVLVVPISFVTDHVNTSYELDIELRESAEAHGIDYYEVTAGLNTHPLFIRALGEAAVAQLELPLDASQLRFRGDGVSHTYPLRPLEELPRLRPGAGSVHCPSCGSPHGARQWTVPGAYTETDVSPERPPKRDPSTNQASKPSSTSAS